MSEFDQTAFFEVMNARIEDMRRIVKADLDRGLSPEDATREAFVHILNTMKSAGNPLSREQLGAALAVALTRIAVETG